MSRHFPQFRRTLSSALVSPTISKSFGVEKELKRVYWSTNPNTNFLGARYVLVSILIETFCHFLE